LAFGVAERGLAAPSHDGAGHRADRRALAGIANNRAAGGPTRRTSNCAACFAVAGAPVATGKFAGSTAVLSLADL